jgi:hypothetical protein
MNEILLAILVDKKHDRPLPIENFFIYYFNLRNGCKIYLLLTLTLNIGLSGKKKKDVLYFIHLPST